MTSDFSHRTAEFRSQLDALISAHWDAIRPVPDDYDIVDLDAEDLEALESTLPAGWVLVVASQAIEVDGVGPEIARFSPDYQNAFFGIGLLCDCLASWVAR